MSIVTTKSGTYSPQEEWRSLALVGGIIATMGFLAIVLPYATGIALTYVIGALLVLGGIAHAGQAYTARGWKGSIWQASLAAVSIVAGIVLLANPVIGLLSLTLLVIAFLFIDGMAELGTSLRMAGEPGRGWIAASGVLSLVLAIFLWSGFPVDAVWVVGVVVGLSLFTTGLSMIAVAYGGRRAGADVTKPATEPRSA